jgi:16S rRNA G966 N2-methylase RsmD
MYAGNFLAGEASLLLESLSRRTGNRVFVRVNYNAAVLILSVALNVCFLMYCQFCKMVEFGIPVFAPESALNSRVITACDTVILVNPTDFQPHKFP